MEFLKKNFLLILILTLAAFFRFYGFLKFQYWSGDEEVLVATVRHIVWDKSPSLIVQNANLGFGLGPYYHYILSPIFFIFSFNLILLFGLPSLLGILTTYLIYVGARELGGKTQGYIASFIYASSFLVSLFDRRLHHLMPNAFLAALTFYLLSRLVNKKLKFTWLLAFPAGFALHSDPSLLVLTIAIGLTLLVSKCGVTKKQILGIFTVLSIFFIPFFIAEIKYDGAVVKPIINSLTKPTRGESIASNFNYFSPLEFLDIYTRTLFTKPDNFIEQHFCYCDYPDPFYSPFSQVIGVIILSISLLIFLYEKNKRTSPRTVIWIIIGSFVFGIFVFNILYKGVFHQHYFSVIFPIFAIITSEFLYFVYLRRTKVLYIFLAVFFIFNLYTLFNSSVKYPLFQKIRIVRSAVSELGVRNFSLYSSKDGYIEGGGWTEIFIQLGKPPVKSYWFDYWEWIYRAYSLYPGPVQTTDPEVIIWLYKNSENHQLKAPVIKSFGFEDVNLTLYENNF